MMPVKPRYPRRPAEPFVVIADVDGTIMVPRIPGTKIPYGDPDALREGQVPNEVVVTRLKALENGGFQLRFCSGRSEELRQLTVEQLEGAGFRGVDDRLQLQDEWGGWDQLRRYKIAELEDWDAVLHVGDQRIDEEAAMFAGAAFLHVDSFAAGDGLDCLFCWECGCTFQRACPQGCWLVNGRLCSSCHRGPNQVLGGAS